MSTATSAPPEYKPHVASAAGLWSSPAIPVALKDIGFKI